jgi:hypothetical protein
LFEGADADVEANPGLPNEDVLPEPVAFEKVKADKPDVGLEPIPEKGEEEDAIVGSVAAEVCVENKLVPPNVPGTEFVVEEAKSDCPTVPVAFDGAEVDDSPGLGVNRPGLLVGLFDVVPDGAELVKRWLNKPPPPVELLGKG